MSLLLSTFPAGSFSNPNLESRFLPSLVSRYFMIRDLPSTKPKRRITILSAFVDTYFLQILVEEASKNIFAPQ